MLSTVLSLLTGKVVAWIASGVGVLAALLFARQSGKKAQELKDLQAQAEVHKEIHDAQVSSASLPDQQLDDSLRQWGPDRQ